MTAVGGSAGLLFTSLSGWVLVVLLGATVALPYLLRGRAVVAPGDRTPFLVRLRPHFWLGYALAPLTLAHLWPAMSGGWLRGADRPGLYLASGAFLLLFAQVALGRRLRTVRRGRRSLRRLHFWTMAALGLLALGHVALDGATLRLFLS